MESTRLKKVSRLLQKELADIFQRENKNILPGKMITVTVVRVSSDLSLAKVYLSVFPKEKDEDYIKLFNEYKNPLRNELGHRIRNQVRKIPELAFYLDDTLDYIDNIDRLLKK